MTFKHPGVSVLEELSRAAQLASSAGLIGTDASVVFFVKYIYIYIYIYFFNGGCHVQPKLFFIYGGCHVQSFG